MSSHPVDPVVMSSHAVNPVVIVPVVLHSRPASVIVVPVVNIAIVGVLIVTMCLSMSLIVLLH